MLAEALQEEQEALRANSRKRRERERQQAQAQAQAQAEAAQHEDTQEVINTIKAIRAIRASLHISIYPYPQK